MLYLAETGYETIAMNNVRAVDVSLSVRQDCISLYLCRSFTAIPLSIHLDLDLFPFIMHAVLDFWTTHCINFVMLSLHSVRH